MAVNNEMEVTSRRDECFTGLRSVIDVLDLAVDRRLKAPLPASRGLGKRFRLSPEMDLDSPLHCCKMAVSMIAASTGEQNSRVLCTIDALDLAVDGRRISVAAGLPSWRREPFRSCPEMTVESLLYGNRRRSNASSEVSKSRRMNSRRHLSSRGENPSGKGPSDSS
ncbi:unnamed protein product [Macrosiphum euphorbiae]|uniref:Uncharacterized protein n=1 Tax=Macrosiphum euphorbiae TaxID=13131 RepID=A0AAV0XNH2_9HEMI|nr:unnamed protein product [Macrosiphum euphorbiae]